MALAGVAHADAKADVTALVRANVAAIAASDDTAFDATFRADAVRVLPHGQGSMDSLAEKFYGRRVEGVKHVPHLTITVDKQVAWFSGTIDATYRIAFDNRPPARGKTKWSVAGVAIDDHGWKLAAIDLAPMTEVEQLATTIQTAPVAKSGDMTIANTVEEWIAKRSFATAGARKPATFGPPLKTWPALGAVSIDAHRFGDAPIAIATAHVAWPVAPASGTDWVLTAIVVETNGAWRWVVLGLSSDADV